MVQVHNPSIRSENSGRLPQLGGPTRFTSQVPGQPGLQSNISSQNKGKKEQSTSPWCGKAKLWEIHTNYDNHNVSIPRYVKDLPLGLMQMEVGWEHVICASWEFKMGQMMYSSPRSPETLL